MLKFSFIFSLIILTLFPTPSFNVLSVTNANTGLIETIDIYQVYNETIFVLTLSYSNTTDILNLGRLLDIINGYEIVISNLELSERSLRWFLSSYNPMEKLPFFLSKGFVVRIFFNDSEQVDFKLIVSKLAESFKTKFILLNKTNQQAVFLTGGNYRFYIEELIKTIDYKYGGFFNITSKLSTEAVIYEYSKDGSRKLTLIASSTLTASPEIGSARTFSLDYSRFLGNLTPSKSASTSKLNFFLYGISVINSTLPIKWSTSYSQNWITTSSYVLKADEKINKILLNASKLDPFIIVTQRASPASFNSSSKLFVSVFNLGSFNASEVRVKLNLPTWLSYDNDTLIFKNISNAVQEKSITIRVVGNISKGVYEIPPPIAYYSYRDTNFTTIGNTLLVAYQEKSFASISFYVKPARISPDILTGPTTFSVFVQNTGNVNATDLNLRVDYLEQKLPNVTARGNETFSFLVDPSKYKSIPLGASVFNELTLKYNNGSRSYEVKIPSSPLFSFSSSFPFINYLSIKSQNFTTVYNLTNVSLSWESKALGLMRSSKIRIDKSILDSQGLKHLGKDSFNEERNFLLARYSFNRGYEHFISLVLNITKHDNFVIPAFQLVEPLNKEILIDPLVFSSVLDIERFLNSTILRVGESISISVNVINKGDVPLYDVNLRDYLAAGWVLLSGNNMTSVSVLRPNESLSLSYVAKASSPIVPNIGSSVVTFNLFGKTFIASSGNLTLKISTQVKFSLLTWNFKPLDGGILKIYSTKGTSVANLTIENGNAVWEGYLDDFVVKVLYKDAEVLSQSIKITATNNTFELKTFVFDIRIKVLDILGIPVSNAKILIKGNLTKEFSMKEGGYDLDNIPKGVYEVIVRIGNYEYKVPLVVNEFTSRVVVFNLPILSFGDMAIPIHYLVGGLLLFFMVSFIFVYTTSRRRIKRSS